MYRWKECKQSCVLSWVYYSNRTKMHLTTHTIINNIKVLQALSLLEGYEGIA